MSRTAVSPAPATAAPARITHARHVALGDDGIADRFDIAAFIAALDARDPALRYDRFRPAVHDAWRAMTATLSADQAARVHAIAMIEAIAGFARRAPADGYPPSTCARFEATHQRILDKIAAADWSGYDRPRDLLWKELGLAFQWLIPGGARVILPSAAFARNIAWRGGAGQALKVARLLATTGGNRRFFELHTHNFELARFNAEGWSALFLQVADLLDHRPAMRGAFVGPGWLYDPALPAVSPRLAYHLGMTVPHGAEVFFSRAEGAESYALIKSPTRRAEFAAGRYRPRLHVLVWPRRPLLAWAARERARGVP